MSIRSALASWLSPSVTEPSWLAASGLNPTSPDGLADPSPAELRGLAAIHAATSLISSALSTVDWHIVERLPTGGKRRVDGGDAARALAEWSIPSKASWISDCLLAGNGVAVLRKNNRRGVAKIERIDPARVQLAVLPDGSHQFEISERADLYQPAEIIAGDEAAHLIYQISANHPYIGASPLTTVAPSLDLVLQIRDSGRMLYRQAAAVNVALLHPKTLSSEAATRLKQSLISATTGRERFKPLVLMEGMKLETISPASIMDAQLAEMGELSTRIVSQAYSVPSALLGSTESVSFSNSVEQARAFSRFCLRPWAARVGDCLSRALLSADARAAGYTVEVDVSAMTRGDGTELADTASKLVNGGVLSANEVRDWFNREDIEGGDQLRMPVNTMPPERWLNPDPDPDPDPEPEDPDPEEPEPEPEPRGVKRWFR